MPEVSVINSSREKVGSLSLETGIFDVPLNKPLIHEVYVRESACRRQGTASTKTRGEVSGGGKKPWKQKGTGRARHGSIRSPLWRGGGITFGPTPRDYSYSIPKKKYRGALFSVLSAKVRDGEMLIFDDLRCEGKTKSLVALLKRVGVDRGALLVVSGQEELLERAARNLSHITCVPVKGLTVSNLLSHRYLLMTEEGVKRLAETWTP